MMSKFEVYVAEGAVRGANLVGIMHDAIDGFGLRSCVRGTIDSKNAEWQAALLRAAGGSARAAEIKQQYALTPTQEWGSGPGRSLEDALWGLI